MGFIILAIAVFLGAVLFFTGTFGKAFWAILDTGFYTYEKIKDRLSN